MTENQKLGPFELISVLGRGGMGTVYEAIDTNTGSRVALKALSPVYSFDEHFRHRFELEIEALKQLHHPNIVQLLSHGQEDGNLFFAMELVVGDTLFTEQKNGQVFPSLQVVDIARQVCAGLRHAHDRGIIHRDLKPGNLMRDPLSTIKITDFGIAKSFGATHITSEGNVVGTMDFMAPEQARGKAATARSDMFSLGAVMYSLLSGHPPFVADSIDRTFESLLSDKPPKRINQIVSDVPDDLAKLIHGLLEKDPEKRIGTARTTERRLQYVMESLHDRSRADTQVVGQRQAPTPAPDANDDGQQTFITDEPRAVPAGTGPTIAEAAKPKKATKLLQGKPKLANTVGETRRVKPKPVSAKQDFYNEVSTQEKNKQVETNAGRPPFHHIWPIAIAFIAAMSLVVYGIWIGFIRKPSAQELLQAIDQESDTPTQVRNEMDRFLALYPEHGEVERIVGLRKFADALAYRNNLRLKRGLSNKSLSVIERQFFNVTNLTDQDAPTALQKVSDFISVHRQDEGLTNNELKALQHAQTYVEKLKGDAPLRISQYREHIEQVIERARETATESKSEARAQLQSLIQIYEGADYADDLLKHARDLIRQLDE